jgi:hypothetical protein
MMLHFKKLQKITQMDTLLSPLKLNYYKDIYSKKSLKLYRVYRQNRFDSEVRDIRACRVFKVIFWDTEGSGVLYSSRKTF